MSPYLLACMCLVVLPILDSANAFHPELSNDKPAAESSTAMAMAPSMAVEPR